MSAKAVAKEFNDEEDSGIVNERVTQNWFRHFKESDISLKDNPRSRRPFIVKMSAFLNWLNNNQAQIDGQQNLVLQKAPL